VWYILSKLEENVPFFPNQREKCVESGIITKIATLTHNLSTLNINSVLKGILFSV
jgi:hypothetical protein